MKRLLILSLILASAIFCVFFEPLSAASSTSSVSYIILVSISFIVFMSTGAVSLARIYSRRPISTQKVFLIGYRFQMPWINAMRDSAQVVKYESRCNRSNEMFVRESVSQDYFSYIVGKKFSSQASVSERISIGRPFPTSCTEINCYFSKKSFNSRDGGSLHKSSSFWAFRGHSEGIVA